MDLSIVADRVDNGAYLTLKSFLEDIELIVSNAIEYNPVTDSTKMVNRVKKTFFWTEKQAKALHDSVLSMVRKLDPHIVSECERISKERENQTKVNEPREEELNTRGSKRKKDSPQKENEGANPNKKKKVENNSEEEEEEESDGDKIVDDEMQDNLYQKFERENGKEEMEEDIVLDQRRLGKIVDLLVEKTKELTVEQMIHLRSHIYVKIFEYRTEADKTKLLKMLESIARNGT